ncbi:MAG: leucine-rich repeat domain-containing protein [Clostridia bacterium]|nr:leucine-rich repeat domain-containing protein [Clostridia bacterium]
MLIMTIAAALAIVACGDGHTHDLEEIAQVAATCSAKGNINYWHCKSCDKYYLDQSANDEISKEDTVIDIDSNNHSIVTHAAKSPTCTEIGWDDYVTCSDCSYTTYRELPAFEHNYKYVAADNIRHEYKCVNCLDVKNYANHTVTGGVCTECNYTIRSASVGLEFFEEIDSYSVNGIGECTDTDIIIPSEFNGLPVTSIRNTAFLNCSSITSITIPNTVTSIGHSAFALCTSLKSVIIPDSVKTIGSSAFDGCTALTNVTLPDGITSIESAMFQNCTSLRSIIIPDSVTTISNHVFFDCNSLSSISIPNGITYIGPAAFSGCDSLIYNEFSNGLYLGNKNNPYVVLMQAKSHVITSCTIYNNTKVIYSAFSGCTLLTSIVIPNSVAYINEDAFRHCTSLTIYCIAASNPGSWSKNWNNDRPVVWSYSEQ